MNYWLRGLMPFIRKGNQCKLRDAASVVCNMFPPAKRALPLSWRLLKAWKKHELPAQAPPFSDLILAGLVGLSVSEGLPGLACALALAYHCCLRTGEAFAVTLARLMLDITSGALLLPQTKKGIRDSVSITDPAVLALLHQYLPTCPRFSPLLGCAPQAARSNLNALLRFFSLHEIGFRWYSCRRGGATAEFRVHGQMERILARGR